MVKCWTMLIFDTGFPIIGLIEWCRLLSCVIECWSGRKLIFSLELGIYFLSFAFYFRWFCFTPASIFKYHISRRWSFLVVMTWQFCFKIYLILDGNFVEYVYLSNLFCFCPIYQLFICLSIYVFIFHDLFFEWDYGSIAEWV